VHGRASHGEHGEVAVDELAAADAGDGAGQRLADRCAVEGALQGREGLEVGAREAAEAGHERLVEAGEHGSGVRHGFGDGAEVAQGHQRTNQAISGRGAATGERWMYCR
jgi:hypothetical protein